MSDDVGEEVDRFIGNLSADDEPPKPRRRKVREPKAPAYSEEASADDDEDDEDESLLPRELPRPSETHKSLGSLLSKHKIGEDPEFRIQLHRVLPKYFPGGIQAHGYLDEFVHPINEEYISSEYGGGTYEVRVLGPDPKTQNGVRRYDSIKVEVAGPPNQDRLARSVRAKLDAVAQPPPQVQGPVILPPQENPTLATQALKMASEMADREREERRRAEDKASSTADAARSMFDPVIESERRRADEVLKVERERSAVERQHFEERLRESREELHRLESKLESIMNGPQVSVADELGKILPMVRGDGEAAASAQRASESITKSILDRHQLELESMSKQHQSLIESLRGSHVAEINSLREANRREIEAERESGRLREQRHEESLRAEREERRRDQEAFKKMEDERDRQWRDRLEQQDLTMKAQWETRVEVQKTNYESQLQWLRSEIEQLQTRLKGFELQAQDRGDLVKQLASMRDLRSVAKDALGIEDPQPQPSGGGGIGLSGDSAPSWTEVLNTAIENLPQIWATVNGQQGAAPPAPPQGATQPVQQPQQPQPGQIVQTPQGPMVVVIDPRNGQLALAPKDQFDAYQAEQRAATSRRVGPGVRPRGIFGPSPQKPSDGIPVPNMAEGLPKPRPWGEPVQPPMPEATVAQQAQPVQAPQGSPVPVAPRPAPRGRPVPQGNMDQTKLMIANEVAKLVHVSVEGGDEPEEFVEKVLKGNYPPMIVQTIAAMSDDDVIAGIKQVQPNSAGATPAGQRFVHEALTALRAAL